MDNRITKKRLSDFLAYEWIMLLVVIVAAIVVLELVFTVSAARLTAGQEFKYYYDINLYEPYGDGNTFYDVLGVDLSENGKTFSYDVLKVDTETLNESYDVLSVRLSVQEGDAIFTSSYEDAEKGVQSRAKTLIDGYSVYDFERLLSDAKSYLSGFTVDGGDIYSVEDYDTEKIAKHFDERMKKDNRFRTEEQKAAGRILETERIKMLALNTRDFEKILTVGKEKGLFFTYTKYEQTMATTDKKEQYEKAYERELAERKDAIYGLNLNALTYSATAENKKDASRYFKLSGNDTAENVVLLVFDFLKEQPDLQFETISFIDTIVRTFSDILDA